MLSGEQLMNIRDIWITKLGLLNCTFQVSKTEISSKTLAIHDCIITDYSCKMLYIVDRFQHKFFHCLLQKRKAQLCIDSYPL